MMAAELRMSSDTPAEEKEALVDGVIARLGLAKVGGWVGGWVGMEVGWVETEALLDGVIARLGQGGRVGGWFGGSVAGWVVCG